MDEALLSKAPWRLYLEDDSPALADGEGEIEETSFNKLLLAEE